MPARSKTLGPGFMRGSGGTKAGSGYVSSPDAGGPDLSTIRITSRFSAIPETNYHGELTPVLYFIILSPISFYSIFSNSFSSVTSTNVIINL